MSTIHLFAIVGTWMEADVIDACVRNAFTQGCERVLLVDNDSPDETVAIATAAGAELAMSFTTSIFEEQMRIDLMNSVVRQVSAASGLEHLWWLYLDADEFSHGPGGLTLRQYLETLDARYRVVGARYFDHFPSQTPAYVPGTHPLDTMPLCRFRAEGRCGERHHKHPLQRFDRDGPTIVVRPGFHSVSSTVSMFEPETAIFLHHFPLREEHTTRARLAAFCAPREDNETRAAYQNTVEEDTWGRTSLAMQRWRNLEIHYGRAPDTEGLHRGCAPWATQVVAADAVVARWY